MSEAFTKAIDLIEEKFDVSFSLRELGKIFHEISKEKGFWSGVVFTDDIVDPSWQGNQESVAIKIALIADEAFEALREHRKGFDQLIGEELADVIIRALELGTALGFDMGLLILNKTRKNILRPHKHDRRY